MTILFLLWLASLCAYLLWVYFILPELLYEGNHRGMNTRIGYFLFAGLTAGVGPVVWYFLRVDRNLKRMAASQPNHRA